MFNVAKKRITDEALRAEYAEAAGRPMNDADFKAFWVICAMLDVAPVGTYQEIKTATLRAMEAWGNQLKREMGFYKKES